MKEGLWKKVKQIVLGVPSDTRLTPIVPGHPKERLTGKSKALIRFRLDCIYIRVPIKIQIKQHDSPVILSGVRYRIPKFTYSTFKNRGLEAFSTRPSN